MCVHCGLKCVEEYYSSINKSFEAVSKEITARECECGISVYDLVECLRNDGISANAYKCFFMYLKAPYIIYLPKQKHFMLVKKIGWMVEIHDSNFGSKTIPFIVYLFIYQNYIITLDNN